MSRQLMEFSMDHHIKDFYHSSNDTPSGNFHSVIALHEAPDISWKAIKDKVPALSRGWYELALLDSKDRIDFTRDFWLSKLPYKAGLDNFLNRFFSSLDDICIFITQKKYGDPYEAHMVYSIKDDGGFFRGMPPITDARQAELEKLFPDRLIPKDYLAFLNIHDGFCKTTDCTGITSSYEVPHNSLKLQTLIQESGQLESSQGKIIDPKTLIPFYESFGMPFYQCFWTEWYPEEEMGNVYYSGSVNAISDVFCKKSNMEVMAFPTFIDWLMFYLERIE